MWFAWLRAQYGGKENLSHGYVNIEENKSVENFEARQPRGEKSSSGRVQPKISQRRQQECPHFENHEAWGSQVNRTAP